MGKQVVLQEGDLIESSMLKDFVYNQGHEGCGTNNRDACIDNFNYIPYGEWVGKGGFEETKIKINPITRETMIASGM